MTRLSWSSGSRGAEVRPPTFRVYVAPVVSPSQADQPRPAEWRGEQVAEHWQPLRMGWGVNGEPTTLTLRRVLGVGPGRATRTRPEDDRLIAGDRVRLAEAQGGGPRGTARREWFCGCVAQQRIGVQAADPAEVCEAVAYGPEVLLRGKVVSGQWHAIPDVDSKLIDGSFADGDLVRENTFRSHLPVVFNERGLPNASPATSAGRAAAWHLDGDAEADDAGCRTFEAPGRHVPREAGAYDAGMWTAGPALRSLIEVVDGYEVLSPRSMSLLPAALDFLVIGEVNVEGMNLLEALCAVLLPVGYGFAIEPWAREDQRHALRVFELRGTTQGSRVRKPYMAPIRGAGVRITDPTGQRAEVQRIEFIRDNHNAVNEVTVVGDQKRKQVTLAFGPGGSQLKPAWDTEAHDLADWATDDVIDPMQWPAGDAGELTIEYFDEHYGYGAKGKAECRHVFRSFAWNEDGAFHVVIAEMPDLADYSADGEGNCVRRPRPVGPTFLRDDDDADVRNFPAFVQLGVAGDEQSWIQVPAVIWADRAGLTIPIDPLWRWHPYASAYARHATSGEETLFEKYGDLSYLTLLHNALRDSGEGLALRLVGSVECDEAVSGTAERRVRSSWPLKSARVVRAENRFRYRAVPSGSDPFDLPATRHDIRDDAADAAECARAVRGVLEDEVGHGSIVLRHVTRSFAPGDAVPATRGRVIDLTVRGGEGARAPVVVAVVWNFQAGGNKTELLLDTPLLRVLP